MSERGKREVSSSYPLVASGKDVLHREWVTESKLPQDMLERETWDFLNWMSCFAPSFHALSRMGPMVVKRSPYHTYLLSHPEVPIALNLFLQQQPL